MNVKLAKYLVVVLALLIHFGCTTPFIFTDVKHVYKKTMESSQQQTSDAEDLSTLTIEEESELFVSTGTAVAPLLPEISIKLSEKCSLYVPSTDLHPLTPPPDYLS